MKDLPSIYQNKIDHFIDNQQSLFRNKGLVNNSYNNLDLSDIDKVLNDRHRIFLPVVEIHKKDGTIIKQKLVSKANDVLILSDNSKIDIKDVDSINLI